MSHFKQRKEKNCLNCNAEVLGRYCYVCGQENTEPKQTIGHLFSHFFNDITHFDGKFFSTLGTLLRRPGLLTLEYVRGRKARYLDPVRMYIFTSAIFFLIFFKTSGHVSETFGAGDETSDAATVENMSDSSLKIYSLKEYDTVLSRKELIKREDRKNNLQFVVFGLKLKDSVSVDVYDSIQQALSPQKRDGLLKNYAKRTAIELNKSYQRDPKHFVSKIINNFLHRLPQMLFISFPLFAFILKIIYWRRKQFYYTDHVIFTIHLYIFTFIILLLNLLLNQIHYKHLTGITEVIGPALSVLIFFYQYKAMRNFYQQRRTKTVFKFILLNVLACAMLIFLTLAFFVFGSATLE